jgi:predicted amidophosphoribosyltransferase
VLSLLLDVLAPPGCLVCRAPLRAPGLCAACRAATPLLRDPCPRCALPRPCAPCPARAAPFAAAWAPVAHDGPARDLVLALKLRGAYTAAEIMAAQIAARAPWPLLDGGGERSMLVPVPPDPGRLRRRGLDPAWTLARMLMWRTDRPMLTCLVRTDDAPRQVGRRRAERRTAPAVKANGRVPVNTILVDDVQTTGATLAACAAALRAAGSRNVSALTYARTLTAP